MSDKTLKKLKERKWTLAALKDFGYPDIDEQHLFDLDGADGKKKMDVQTSSWISMVRDLCWK